MRQVEIQKNKKWKMKIRGGKSEKSEINEMTLRNIYNYSRDPVNEG